MNSDKRFILEEMAIVFAQYVISLVNLPKPEQSNNSRRRICFQVNQLVAFGL